MSQYLKQAALVFCVFVIAAFPIKGLRAQDGEPLAYRLQLNDDDADAGLADCTHKVAASKPQGDGVVLRVKGNATEVCLDLRRTTIAQVLTALAASFDISYNSSIVLDKVLDGTYTGSLPHVISRVLEGYNYAIKQEKSKIAIIVFEKVEEQAAAAPRQHPVSEHRALIARASRD
jgi:hypothetical protein